jgi:hypothetical protein
MSAPAPGPHLTCFTSTNTARFQEEA